MDKQMVISIISCCISAALLLITLLRIAYKLVCKNERAKADRAIIKMQIEHSEAISNIEHQHREEINYKDKVISEKDKDLYELREKYLLLLNERRTPSNNDP